MSRWSYSEEELSEISTTRQDGAAAERTARLLAWSDFDPRKADAALVTSVLGGLLLLGTRRLDPDDPSGRRFAATRQLENPELSYDCLHGRRQSFSYAFQNRSWVTYEEISNVINARCHRDYGLHHGA